MKHRLALLALIVALPAAAQPRAPVPDPRLEVALSTTVIKESERSVQFDKTIPPIALRQRPVVDEPYMAKMGESVYVDRRLVPPRGAPRDPAAVYISPEDR